MVKTNGFEKPLEPLQIVTWVALPTLIALFYALFLPLLANTPRVIISIFYGLFALGSVILGALACYIDPVDCLVHHSVNDKANNTENDAVNSSVVYCFLCRCNVNFQSKHCRSCKKCIDRYDHHCLWLNNCIGRKNYNYFVVLLVLLVCLMALQFGVGMHHIVDRYVDPNHSKKTVKEGYPSTNFNFHTHLIVLCLVMSIAGILLVIVFKFLIFHVYLIRHDMTTYDFIIHIQHRRHPVIQSGAVEECESTKETKKKEKDLD